MTRTWISHMYMAGALIAFLYIFGKRLRLQRTVLRMKMQFVNGKTVYITDMNVTPFAAGLFRPKIVLPKVMADNYTKDEMEAIIRHEQTHIRLCHLWYYFIWDILRCLIWFNPYLTIYQKYFRSDMQDICDRVCIQSSGKSVQEYGLLLLKTLKILRDEQKNISSAAAYWGNNDFEDIKSRMEKIADLRPYGNNLCRGIALAATVLICIIFIGIKNISYARYNEMKDILVYEYNPANENTVILDNSDRLQQIISYNDNAKGH